MFVIEVRRRI